MLFDYRQDAMTVTALLPVRLGCHEVGE